MIKIVKANTKNQYGIIEKLSYEIFHEVYDKYIPHEITDSFLAEYLVINAIENQVKHEHFTYYLLVFNSHKVGYIGLKMDDTTLLLSKLYILRSFRGKKIGKAALEYVNKIAKHNQVKKIDLLVKQHNQKTIEFYLKKGFKIIDSIEYSFPNGCFANDYKMSKML